MKISGFSVLLLLCMSLYATATLAEGIADTDKDPRKAMSYEEYSQHRENMRLQMKKGKTESRKEQANAAEEPVEKMEKSQRSSAYGQGYLSRSPAQDRPAKAEVNRPEHTRAERFDRSDMGRRP